MTVDPAFGPPGVARAPVRTHETAPALWTAARRLEATFLSQMLESAGVGEQTNSLSGSPEQGYFAPFQRQVLAESMQRAGGIGLAEKIFQSLVEKTHDA